MLPIQPALPIGDDLELAGILNATCANVAASEQLMRDSRTTIVQTWAQVRSMREAHRLSCEALRVPVR